MLATAPFPARYAAPFRRMSNQAGSLLFSPRLYPALSAARPTLAGSRARGSQRDERSEPDRRKGMPRITPVKTGPQSAPKTFPATKTVKDVKLPPQKPPQK